MTRYYALHLLSGSITELLANSVEEASKILEEADFYYCHNKYDSFNYTFYKETHILYCNDAIRVYLPRKENLSLIEIIPHKE